MTFKKHTPFLALGFSLLFLSGCDFFKSHKVSSKEINAASAWSESDQYPVFPGCETSNSLQKKNCFEEALKKMIQTGIESRRYESQKALNARIVLSLVVDKEGIISLEFAEMSDEIEAALPDLRFTLEAIVENLPRVVPAIKTNVEESVVVRFELPVKINAQVGNSNAP